MASTVMITGANRGIGLEFARQYGEDGWDVIGTARNPEEAEQLQSLRQVVEVLELDVTDRGSIDAVRGAVGDMTRDLDLLINNAGVMGSKEPFEDLDDRELLRVFDVNCVGCFRVARALKPLMSTAPGTMAFVTSLMGSIEDNRSGGSYPYRLSKAALNMFAKTLSEDVDPETLRVVLLHPGWVQTRMGGPNAKITPGESVRGMRRVIDELTAEQHGRFMAYDGEELPW